MCTLGTATIYKKLRGTPPDFNINRRLSGGLNRRSLALSAPPLVRSAPDEGTPTADPIPTAADPSPTAAVPSPTAADEFTPTPDRRPFPTPNKPISLLSPKANLGRLQYAFGIIHCSEDMASGDDPTRKSFASKFRRKKITTSRKEFRWLPEYSTRIRSNFERRGATRLRDMFTDIRKSGQRPNWIGEGVWADLSSAWATPEFIKMREQNKQNRASDYGGLGSSLHTGGSVPHTEHRRRLDDFLRVRESRQSTGEGSSSGSAHTSEYHTWSEVVGGRQRGRVYGMGSQAFAIEGSSYTSAFYDPSGAEESVSERVAALTREIEEMKRVQAREIEEMRKAQNEMQAELQSYRAGKQRKKDQQEQPSADSEDTDDD
ncbi:hypothetical protein KFK09_021275 [Dendrobium nobile]|uniref:Transposase n=1 Tax=Dendrobium nobile TaxID=94219 RepID=A0A8T3APY3_DENNO|nr:hypothetical protein KFK09_021275 [Dendrobium nobile]